MTVASFTWKNCTHTFKTLTGPTFFRKPGIMRAVQKKRKCCWFQSALTYMMLLLNHSTNMLLTKNLWGQDRWVFTKSFSCVFMKWDGNTVHKQAKRNETNIKPSWPHNLGQWKIYYMVYVYASGEHCTDSWVCKKADHNTGFDSSCPLE